MHHSKVSTSAWWRQHTTTVNCTLTFLRTPSCVLDSLRRTGGRNLEIIFCNCSSVSAWPRRKNTRSSWSAEEKREKSVETQDFCKKNFFWKYPYGPLRDATHSSPSNSVSMQNSIQYSARIHLPLLTLADQTVTYLFLNQRYKYLKHRR